MHFGIQDDATKRAEGMLKEADKMNCRKFVRAEDVVSGNSKLNMAFVAHLFNTFPCLEPRDDVSALSDFDLNQMDETREERSNPLHKNFSLKAPID